MITFPNAKINTGLNVVEKRPDGFHNIETVFYPVALSDILEILPSDTFSFHTTGIRIDGDLSENLVIKAYWLLQNRFSLPPVRIHLHKVIPMGSGLGGGSSDAAFTLTMLNELFRARLTDDQLREAAVLLGADCPFFIGNQPAYATGTGNMTVPVSLDLSEYTIVIVKPPLSVNTAWAYRNIIPHKPERNLAESIKRPPEEWKFTVTNDFETPVFRFFPEIESIRNTLYNLGSVYASLTGSGSAVFGLFRDIPEGLSGNFPPDYFVFLPSK